MLVTVLAIGWLLAAMVGLLAYRLMVDRGRLLLQIERLEQRFAEVVLPQGPADLGLPIGAPAPDFELPDLDGAQHALSEWRGTPVLLIFFDPECRFCQRMAPQLREKLRDPGNGGLRPVVVTMGDVNSNCRLLRERGIECPVLVQDGAEVAGLFRAEVTPSAHLVDEHGAIASPLALGADDVLTLLSARLSGEGENPRGAAPMEAVSPISGRLRSIADSKLNRSGLTVGMAAPPFSLPRSDGGELSLAEYQGERVLLVFSDPACAPCNVLAPRLERFHRRSPGTQVIMVSRGTPDENRAKAAELGLTFPIGMQRHWEVSRAYGMFATPIAYLIDERGAIASDVAVGTDAILDLAATHPERGKGRKEVAAQG